MNRLLIICFILQLALTGAQIILSVKSVMKFPHFIGNNFSMQIQTLVENSKLSNDRTDRMVIRIADLNFTEMERAILNYGAQDSIDEEFKGKYMDIKIWETNPSLTKMNISIMFKRNAHRKYLEIFYFSAQNKLKRIKYLKNLSFAKRLFHELIDLYNPSKLLLSVHPINVDRKEIIVNDLVMASCRAFDGIPQVKPKFGNHTHLNVTDTKYNEKNNEIKMFFHVSLRDHFSYFTCIAENVTELYTICIHHHPTKLQIYPTVTNSVRSNSTITCKTTDGYPDPKVNWHFIEGPQNAGMFYNINEKNNQIHINSNSPTGSKWTFKCTIKSNITKTHKILNKTISFVIAKNPMEIYDEKCLNSRSSEIEKNGKLYDDIKLILNITNQMKEQMEIQRKEQNEINQKIEIEMKTLRNEQKKMSDKLNDRFQILNTETHRKLKHVNDSLQPVTKIIHSFIHVFDQITYSYQRSLVMLTVFPLSVHILTDFVEKDNKTFRYTLEFRNNFPETISHIDITYICCISALKSSNNNKSATFDIKFRGIGDLIHSVKYPSNEIFDKNFDDTRLSIRCKFIKYLLKTDNN